MDAVDISAEIVNYYCSFYRQGQIFSTGPPQLVHFLPFAVIDSTGVVITPIRVTFNPGDNSINIQELGGI